MLALPRLIAILARISGGKGKVILPYIQGSPINAYCSTCKADKEHTVLDVAGVQVREVRCVACGQVGSFRAPRARTRAALLEIATRRRDPPPPRSGRKKQGNTPRDILRRLVGGRDPDQAILYRAGASLVVGDLVTHPTFGLGVVTAITDKEKARIAFDTGERVMVCNKG